VLTDREVKRIEALESRVWKRISDTVEKAHKAIKTLNFTIMALCQHMESIELRILELLKEPRRGGWIERKRIKGQVYLYYRWRDETGRVRSKYLGKPDSERAKAALAMIKSAERRSIRNYLGY